MPTLEEMRRWANGENVEGLPERPAKPTRLQRALTRLRGKAGRKTARYSINTEGTDAIIYFGVHSGKALSDIAKEPEGRSYVRWMLKQGVKKDPKSEKGFDEDLIDVANYVLNFGKLGER